jgi:TonB family protein
MIEERIATGGMADVFKARMMGMEGFQKTVAIKRILPNLSDNEEFVRMFIDEAKLAAQLNHNNIIHIYDLGKVDRSHYIAMEFIEGRDLRSILAECAERGLVMPIELALHIATLLASALDYAHKKRDFEDRDLGLVHRDVSPSNVLITNEGDVKLCDFGIAKAASKATETRAGALKGKLQYMSPEQAWGKDIDHRSDIFSLGLVLYEMLTSEKVFSGTSELSVLEQVRDPMITAPSSRNPKVDAEIDRIVFLALNPDREQRYQSADELQRDVEKVLRQQGWTPDRVTLAAFLGQLDGEAVISPKASTEDDSKTPVGAVPPSEGPQGPPQEPPPAEPPVGEVPDGPFGREEISARPPVAQTDPLREPVGVDLQATEPAFEEIGKGRGNKIIPMLLGLFALIVVLGGGWWILGRNGSESPPIARSAPIAVAPTETATPEPTAGLLSEEELIESAREAAAAEIAKQEEELRKRLEEEFPTPTPIPPTATPSPTATETPTSTPTSTPLPPTATPPPPTATPIPPTATPSVREGEIVVAGAGVIAPVVIYREQPTFPARAQALQVEGVVEAEALVGIDGGVEEVRIVSSSRTGVGFEDSSKEAIMGWRFKPATKRGVKVRMWVSIRIPFRLR